MSRSGEMYRPCSVMSSPVLTIAVTSAGAMTCTTPSRKRAAPTPPASVTIIRFLIIYMNCVVVGFGEAKPPQNLLLLGTHGGFAAVSTQQGLILGGTLSLQTSQITPTAQVLSSKHIRRPWPWPSEDLRRRRQIGL